MLLGEGRPLVAAVASVWEALFLSQERSQE
jgi:hypothetical protein